MSFYEEMADVADEILAEYGQACVLAAVTTGEYDPETGETATASTTHAITAAIFNYPQRFVDGTLILVGDKKALVSPVGLTVEPKPGDTFTDAAGAVHAVVNAKATAPAGTTVLWTLQVRK